MSTLFQVRQLAFHWGQFTVTVAICKQWAHGHLTLVMALMTWLCLYLAWVKSLFTRVQTQMMRPHGLWMVYGRWVKPLAVDAFSNGVAIYCF